MIKLLKYVFIFSFIVLKVDGASKNFRNQAAKALELAQEAHKKLKASEFKQRKDESQSFVKKSKNLLSSFFNQKKKQVWDLFSWFIGNSNHVNKFSDPAGAALTNEEFRSFDRGEATASHRNVDLEDESALIANRVLYQAPLQSKENKLLAVQVEIQSFNDCGYHALKNVVCLMNSFLGLYPTNTNSKEVYNHFFKPWSLIIADYRKKNKCSSDTLMLINKNLDEKKKKENDMRDRLIGLRNKKEGWNSIESKEYENLSLSLTGLRDEIARYSLCNSVSTFNLSANEIEMLIKKSKDEELINQALDITVCEGMYNGVPLNLLTSVYGKDFKSSAQTLATRINQSESGLWGIVWIDDEGGHWIGLVVHKNESNQRIYYMDSQFLSSQDFDTYFKKRARPFIDLITAGHTAEERKQITIVKEPNVSQPAAASGISSNPETVAADVKSNIIRANGNLVQLQVQSQDGVAGDCGVQAVKNVVCLMNYFKGEPKEKCCITCADISMNFFNKWKSFIDRKEIKINVTEEVLEADERLKYMGLCEDQIANFIKKLKTGLVIDIFSYQVHQGLETLGNDRLEILEERYFDTYEKSYPATVINAKPSGTWGFIFNTGAHWVGIVVHKINFKAVVYLMDSNETGNLNKDVTLFAGLIK